ncbi:MAG: DUF814 domain-containing protein, partial [Candidatus Aenigmarchaeota archaeon]|nr:DUF814 domain-containing protein [Candidatus Aenigmarchaeota archaeon]
NLKPEPVIYFKENKEFFVSPFKLNALADLEVEKKESFSNAIRDFFSEKKKTKAEIIQEGREKNLDKCLMEEKKFKEQADLFMRNREDIENAIKKFKEEKKIAKPIIEILEKKGTIVLELDGVKFSISMNTQLKNEINRLYEKSKKAGRKIEKIQKLFLEKINIKEEIKNKDIEKKEWYEQFRYFHTSDGFLVIAGKDADTNEKLIKKYCRKNDIVLHAHIPGSPFGIIRSEGGEITTEAKKEAAQFVACYSRFWILKLGLADIYWVTPEQVTKKVPGHQSIKKGSFMIYGKRNFLRVELRFTIGLDDKFKIVKGPLDSVKKRAKYFITLTPGEKEGKELADEIKSKLEKQMGKEDKGKIKNINPDEFLKIVPYGKGDFFKR